MLRRGGRVVYSPVDASCGAGTAMRLAMIGVAAFIFS